MNCWCVWQREGADEEIKSGLSPRVEISNRTLEWMESQRSSCDAIILCGDFNDRYHPRRIFQAGHIIDTSSQLRIPVVSSWPSPSWNWLEDEHGSTGSCPSPSLPLSRYISYHAQWITLHSHILRALRWFGWCDR
jgi:hypothetical protein